eukprot:1684046-Ditylum_brightwellii.AAC.1
MKNAERHKYLSDNQHGGRNGREAPDIVFGKTIMFNTLHLQRANFGCTDCNAKACYNRGNGIYVLRVEQSIHLEQQIRPNF